MSQKEPTEAYVYQPLAVNDPKFPRIYGVGGPRTQCCEGQTYTKEEAEKIVHCVNFGGVLTTEVLNLLCRTEGPSPINPHGSR